MVVVAAVGAAIINAAMSLLQRLGVEDAPRDQVGGTRRLVAHMVRRPVWLIGFVGMGGAFALQAVALHRGSLAVVQPLLTTELFFVVIVLRVWYAVPVRGRDWAYCALAVCGLSLFLVVLAPTNGGRLPSSTGWLEGGVAIVAAAAVLTLAARRGPPWWRALSLGAAASVGFALTAALTKAFSEAFNGGIAHVFETWPTYGVVVCGLGSVLLMQQAFHAGPFAASQATLILVNPFVSVALGALLYGERFPHDPVSVGLGLVGVAAFAVGGIGLCASPLISGGHGDDQLQRLQGRGFVARLRAEGVGGAA